MEGALQLQAACISYRYLWPGVSRGMCTGSWHRGWLSHTCRLSCKKKKWLGVLAEWIFRKSTVMLSMQTLQSTLHQ